MMNPRTLCTNITHYKTKEVIADIKSMAININAIDTRAIRALNNLNKCIKNRKKISIQKIY